MFGITLGLKQIGYIVLAIILLVTMAWASNSYPRKSVVDGVLKARESEIRAEYTTTIKAQETKIIELQTSINDSKVRIGKLDTEIVKLKKKKIDIKKPVTPQETLDTFKALGYEAMK